MDHHRRMTTIDAAPSAPRLAGYGSCSLARKTYVHLPEKLTRSLLDTINENLRHPNSHIQNAAVEALKHFVPAYLLNSEDKIVNNFVSKYLEQLGDSHVVVRRGSALAIGVLPSKFLATRWKAFLATRWKAFLATRWKAIGEMEGREREEIVVGAPVVVVRHPWASGGGRSVVERGGSGGGTA
ncbi:hypothetical protein RHGRI_017671 [Rhododendron griersonianum]|uniref:Uncharacterized protein n=1 Tax=Rhododendron griersonianum TaxID=479676 RepID=A0AAV6JYP3_9ERIC|nr:hypothetical protein RHGRI_017671 [Rhododendron griersonianum]